MEICNTEDGPQTISKIFTIHLTLMLFAGLVLSLEIPLLIKVLTPSEFWVSAFVAFFAVMARIAFNSYYHFVFGLLYGQKTFKVSIVLMITATISVPIYLLFIKSYGILGAFVAALVVYLIQCVLSYNMAQPYYRIPFEWRKILVLCVSSTVLFFLIQAIDIQHSALVQLLASHAASGLKGILEFFHLDHIKDGKLLLILDEKFIFVFEGIS